MEPILSFSRDNEGNLTGVLTSDRGESKVEGRRSPRILIAVGNWEMKFKVGERDITATLAVEIDKKGKLTGQWQSHWGEHEITDIAYERGTLTFKRKNEIQDREWESTFDGRVRADTLSGVIKSEMGEIEAEGKRVNAAAIGTWNLELETEWGKIKQRLRVNPDMSALYGSTPIKKINLDGDQVSFKYALQFVDQEFESSFKGKIAESKLTGEMTTSRGTLKITKKKVVRRSRRPNTM